MNFFSKGAIALSCSVVLMSGIANAAVNNVASYTKLSFSERQSNGAVSTNECGGVFISNDIILTADHCFMNWNNNSGLYKDGNFYYGNNFANYLKPYSTSKKVGWTSIDGVDLAILRTQSTVAAGNGVAIAKLPTACDSTTAKQYVGRTDVTSYLRKDSSGNFFPQAQYGTTNVKLLSVGGSPAANGNYFNANFLMHPGDSGGPWLTDDNTLVGINNATSQSPTDVYGTVICMYVNQIKEAVKSISPTSSILSASTGTTQTTTPPSNSNNTGSSGGTSITQVVISVVNNVVSFWKKLFGWG